MGTAPAVTVPGAGGAVAGKSAGNNAGEVFLFMPDMMFILILALLLFGPKKIPEVARTIAKFRNLGNDLKSKLEAEFQQLETEAQNIVPSPVSELKDAIHPITQIREELKAAVSFDAEPQNQSAQFNTATEKNTTS